MIHRKYPHPGVKQSSTPVPKFSEHLVAIVAHTRLTIKFYYFAKTYPEERCFRYLITPVIKWYKHKLLRESNDVLPKTESRKKSPRGKKLISINFTSGAGLCARL